jgi:hypothetical protein
MDRFVASAPRDDVAHTSHDLSISQRLQTHLYILAARVARVLPDVKRI